ncbi:MAG: MliC family protein [marine benthic group bacterium]|nr:MliC family protein [Gemmatimonadota bacterium]MCL7974983.1 MliC family protein [Gemmatimonadota bacterium]
MTQRNFAVFALAGLLVFAGCAETEQEPVAETEQVAGSGMEGGMANPHSDVGLAKEGMPNPHEAGMPGAGGMENPHAAGAMPGQGGLMEISFSCPDDVTLKLALYSEEDRAEVTVLGETHDLERVRSGSGMKFSDGTWSFFSKGPEAMVMKDDEPVVKDCVAVGHP